MLLMTCSCPQGDIFKGLYEQVETVFAVPKPALLMLLNVLLENYSCVFHCMSNVPQAVCPEEKGGRNSSHCSPVEGVLIFKL